MSEVLERVRAALTAAEREGRPAPGRGTLAREVGVTEYRVRQAMRQLDTERDHEGAEQVTDPASNGQGRYAPDSEVPPWVLEVAEPATALGEPGEPGEHQPANLAPAGEKPSDPRAVPARVTRVPRPWPLAVIALGAAVAVWSGWVGLGELTGFGVVRLLPGLWDDLHLNTAVVLPLSVECYGAYALRCWLGGASLSDRTRRFAGRSAIASLAIGAGAQIVYHLLTAAGVQRAPWPVVVLVACVPVLVLGLASALARLVSADQLGHGGGQS